ncbi:UDP-N-acetylglucosamine transferase subunit ALG13 homolog [Galendromus occidentalis]|uniref:UDP-N-acetylglucosamine transferase subunit ALG13 n=1 Tax=Galendromus occidentalis TaxID=34638 RepID=A0AAJ6QT60_9ACAR|nr:UDP-N-acetylglucosamine transferase subunit ALG13 homolog [Galendromus occidentalis]
MAKAGLRTVFVTVGTTQFDDLVTEVTKLETVQLLSGCGYSKIVVQFGSGTIPKIKHRAVSFFDFKSSLENDMRAADLIISHAGAGSILEAVRHRKSKLIVVVNEKLLDNHQLELARAMDSNGYAACTTVEKLAETIQRVQDEVFVPFPEQDKSKFPEVLNNILGWR